MKRIVLLIFMLAGSLNAPAQGAGSLDVNYGNNGVALAPFGSYTNYITSICLQPDGKIIAAGTTNLTDLGTQKAFALTRFMPDGTVDPSFGVVTTNLGNQSMAEPAAMKLQSDGKIVVAGFCLNSATGYDLAVVRYLSNGSLDGSFGIGGKVIMDLAAVTAAVEISSMALQDDDKIIVAFGRTMSDGLFKTSMLRLNNNGSVDTSYGNNGFADINFSAFPEFLNYFFAEPISSVIQPDGKLVSLFSIYAFGFGMARLNTDGSPDSTFGTNGVMLYDAGEGFYITPKNMVLQNDGKIVIGAFSNIENQDNITSVRLNTNGTFDGSYGTDGFAHTALATSGENVGRVALQADGKIISSGHIWNMEELHMETVLLRHNTNGTPDTTFGTNGKLLTSYDVAFGFMVADILIQEDNKIVIGGIYDSPGIFALSRFNVDDVAGIKKQDYKALSVYPNPAQNTLYIRNPQNTAIENLLITDVTGKTVLQQTGTIAQIDISPLPQGMYFLKVTSPSGSTILKFIKQ